MAEGQQAIAKGTSAWAAVGISSWSDAAAALATIYTAVLLIEWVYKRWKRRKD